jgi:hypothetical protein
MGAGGQQATFEKIGPTADEEWWDDKEESPGDRLAV